MARPTSYSQEVLDKTIDYCQNYKQYGDAIPSIAGLAIYLDITRATLHVWSKDKDKEEFSYIYSKILAAQERKLLNSGLTDEFNAQITKLVLSKHGYSDTQRIEAVVESKLSDEEKAKLLELVNPSTQTPLETA